MKSLLRLVVAAVLTLLTLSGCSLSPNVDLPSAEGDSTGGDGDGNSIDVGDGDDGIGPTINDMGGSGSTCPQGAGAGGVPAACNE